MGPVKGNVSFHWCPELKRDSFYLFCFFICGMRRECRGEKLRKYYFISYEDTKSKL